MSALCTHIELSSSAPQAMAPIFASKGHETQAPESFAVYQDGGRFFVETYTGDPTFPVAFEQI